MVEKGSSSVMEMSRHKADQGPPAITPGSCLQTNASDELPRLVRERVDVVDTRSRAALQLSLATSARTSAGPTPQVTATYTKLLATTLSNHCMQTLTDSQSLPPRHIPIRSTIYTLCRQRLYCVAQSTLTISLPARSCCDPRA